MSAAPMRWRKLGRVFDPVEHKLASGCEEFAQSPQALVFDDFVRVYFASRQRDANGKFLSHVCFAEFTKDFTRVLRVNPAPVIPLGARGTFDEHGIFPINVLRHEGRILGYTTGWSRRVSVSVDTGVGLVVSQDGGETFVRQGDGPVLTSSLREPFLVGDGFVQKYGDDFHMWYIFGTTWTAPRDGAPAERTYKIGHAVSADGVRWRKEEGRRIVADRLGADESQALPTVVKVGSRYHMVFCYRESTDFRANRDRGYRLGHAWSENLRDWTRDDAALGIDVTPGDWDSDMMCYPHLFECDGRVHLLYNGNQFGRRGFGVAVLE